ncbi:MAG: ribonuclease E/G, partial [Alphaproteobacteria bacterium]|nr:ribonuclease E/G [Alphaproteobacteria bacterium]
AALGGIYLGRVRRLDPAMNAAFVDIGQPTDGFLRARDAAAAEPAGRRANIAALVHEGQAIAVRVAAEGFADKGPRLVRLADDPDGSHPPAPACLQPPPDPVARILAGVAEGTIARIVCSDGITEAAVRHWFGAEETQFNGELRQKNAPLFENYGVEDAIASALAPRVDAGGGAELVFDQTETLCAIDVNSSRHVGRAGRGPRDVNMAVMPEIARQLRLRAIGGAIVIDALKMARGDDRKQVLTTLRQALKNDPATGHVLGISNLGLIEMTRTRRGPSLAERMIEPAAGPHPRIDAAAYGAIRALLAGARHQPGARYVLRAAPEVVEALAGALNASFTEAAARVGQVSLDAQPGWPRDKWDVTPAQP